MTHNSMVNVRRDAARDASDAKTALMMRSLAIGLCSGVQIERAQSRNPEPWARRIKINFFEKPQCSVIRENPNQPRETGTERR